MEALRTELLAMADRDLACRERLAAEGLLSTGYNEEIRALHETNADRLADIIREHGWPGPALVGEDGAGAAWLVVQHAISRPHLMRRALVLLRQIDDSGVSAAQMAMLDDRIRIMEGRPQRFGTQFDWDDEGTLSPAEIERPHEVDERRRDAGLDTLADNVARIRQQADADGAGPPSDLSAHRRGQREFAESVGWRDTTG